MKLWWIPKLTLPAVSCLEQIISFNQPFCWWKFAGFHRLKCRRDAMRTAQAAREQPEHTESSCSKCRGCVLQDGTLDACREERMWHPGLPGARGRECWCSCSCSIHSFTLNFSSRWRAGRSGKLTLQEGWCGSGSAVSQGQSCPFRLCWSWKKPKNSGAGSELEAAWQAQPSSCQLQLNPCLGIWGESFFRWQKGKHWASSSQRGAFLQGSWLSSLPPQPKEKHGESALSPHSESSCPSKQFSAHLTGAWIHTGSLLLPPELRQGHPALSPAKTKQV